MCLPNTSYMTECKHATTTRTLPIFRFRGETWTITNHLVKNVILPVTAYMELEEVSPLLF